MSDKDFMSSLDPVLKKSIDSLIKETRDYESAIKSSKDKSKAQIWIALALLNNKIEQINTKTEPVKKIPKQEMDKILKTLETL